MTKKQRFRKLVKLLIAGPLMAALLFGVTAYASVPWPDDCYVASEGACLMDADSGVILFGKNEETAYYPASITKVLTALITLENCENLSETVTFSYDAVHIEEENSTIIGASEGDRLSVLDCLYCLLFQSANEVANALAEHVGAKHPELKEQGENDRQVFIKLMNLKAAELGCTSSHFNNPSGLTDPDHYTSPKDMCLIMRAAIKNDMFLEIERHTYWTHAPIRRYPNADHPWNTVYPKCNMLKRNSSFYYPGTIAGKTGYTMTAGNTLVTACRRDGMTLVATVMNAHANHYNDTTRLFDFGFKNFQSVKVADYDTTGADVERDFTVSGLPLIDSKTISYDDGTTVTFPREAIFSEVTYRLEVADEFTDPLGTICYYYGDREIGQADLHLRPLGNIGILKEAEADPILSETESETAPELLVGTGETGQPGENEGTETISPEEGNGKNPAGISAGASQAAKDVKEKVSGWKMPLWLKIVIAAAALVLAGVIVGVIIKEQQRAKRHAQKRMHRYGYTDSISPGHTSIPAYKREQSNRRRKKRTGEHIGRKR